jgi:tetraacyldisaccharide 4'-kinase
MAEHNWIKVILSPFSWLYGLITRLRNLLYDRGLLPSETPPQFTISVGNLTVGGTGKTPMVEYLIGLLTPAKRIAVLSRGYGRKTKGLRFADDNSSASEIGDEPLQYFSKFKKNVVVAVCEDRVTGARAIHDFYPACDLLILDDAYQHRAIRRQVNILLNDFNRPFYKDLPFPAGRLRETRSGARRADVIVVTKCPENLSGPVKEKIRNAINSYSRPQTPVFFASVQYAWPVSYDGLPVMLKNVIIVAGIANPAPFTIYIRSKYNVMEEVIFPDHYNYTSVDLEHLIKNLKNDTFVLTTEKDMVKLKPLAAEQAILDRFAYLPMKINFGTESAAFDHWINSHT